MTETIGAQAQATQGANIERIFTTPGVHPYDEVTWELRDVVQQNWKTGETVFEQHDVLFPDSWSLNASTIVTTKYFRGALGTPARENSLKQLIDRVVLTYVKGGKDHGYFATPADADLFEHELTWCLLHQVFAFNSPVWFNVGTKSTQQVSACQPYDSLVSTDSGLVKIGDLHVSGAAGSKVMTAHGPAAVLATKHNGVKEVLRVSTKSGHTLDVTADHLVWSVRHRDFVPAGELRVGDSLSWHRNTESYNHASSDIEIAESALAGWLATDGFVGQYSQGTNTYLTVEPHTINDAERAWVTSALELVWPDVSCHERGAETADPKVDFRRFRLYGEVLRPFVTKWDLLKRGATTSFPQHLHTAPLDVAAAYLRSIFQADGYVSIREEGKSTIIGVSTDSEDLMRGVHSLLARFGIFARLHNRPDGREDRHDRWTLFIGNLGDRKLFAQHIGFLSSDKQEKLDASLLARGKAAKSTKTLQIASITSLGSMDVYDIQTGEQEYLSGGLRVHNCFILSVDDSMESILNWYKEEGFIFKGGSGAGLNLSRIRSSKELLSSGGTASGPVSFMRGADASAGTIKSGGATRRAAKMVVLDVDHPDIAEFIDTKAREEDKIRALRDAGFDMDLGGKDIISVQYQNANNSVRLTDEFMRAVESGAQFGLRARSTGEIIERVDARELFAKLNKAAWECADPGVQYDDAINDWHTIPESGRINASNPCFTGDTLVATADGRNAVRIDQLAAEGKPVDVYTKTEGGATVIRSMKDIRCTRKDAAIVTVTMDDGSQVRCTPDHLFMMRDGSYVAAKDLDPGASLKRFDSQVAVYGGQESGALRRQVTGTRGWKWQHHLIGEHKFGSYRDGKGGVHLDHTDGDSLNDVPSNLQILSAAEHAAKTNAENMIGDTNPARRMMNSTWRGNISAAVAGEGNPRFIVADKMTLVSIYRDGVVEDPRRGKRQEWVAWNAYVRANSLVGQVPLARGDGRIQGMEWAQFVSSFEMAPTNHRVVSVTESGFADVFDGEVEQTHNFAVITSGSDVRTGTLSGVFVHNCSEYMSIDDSSCNLSSLNLLKFLREDNTFDAASFAKVVELVITAMDISICFADFPTVKIGENTRSFRQLGIGYANLGALLMATGHGYDSDGGRQVAGAITSLLTGAAYKRSAELAGVVGPYDGYALNKAPHCRVMRKHRAANDALSLSDPMALAVHKLSTAAWKDVIEVGAVNGYRNAQASVLAPTGTIGFMMDCDTTGIEPDFSLVKFKKLVGGGSMQIVNQTIPRALTKLGYNPSDIEAIVAHIADKGHVIDAPGLATEHYEIFDCAMGARPIAALGHVRMMAACQPFLSGAISKTVNLPQDATVDDIAQVHLEGWKAGLKALAVYRDNCKVGQPLSDGGSTATDKAAATAAATAKGAEQVVVEKVVYRPTRTRMPRRRNAVTTSFTVGGAAGYLTSGQYDDGQLGELFLKFGKQGSTLAGMMDAFSIAVSIGLQYGVPLDSFVEKFTNQRFEPAGLTDDPDVRMAQSIMDYVFRRLALDYTDFETRSSMGIHTADERTRHLATGSYADSDAETDREVAEELEEFAQSASVTVPDPTAGAHSSAELMDKLSGTTSDAPMCMTCGVKMQRAGSCYVCDGCGSTSGCS